MKYILLISLLFINNIAYSRSFYTVDKLKNAASWGNSQAQYELGKFYDYGTKHKIFQRDDLALHWYQKSAAQNHAKAKYELGKFYYYGRAGLSKDIKRAIELWRQSAEQNYAAAQQSIGMMYYHGEHLAQDYKLAKHWIKKAVKQDNVYATIHFLSHLHFYHSIEDL